MTEQREDSEPVEEIYFACSIKKSVWKGTGGVKAKRMAEPHPLYPITQNDNIWPCGFSLQSLR